ncbi:MAG: kynureninase [Alphaproteobacteria bacterium]|nr:kynureninase [Alphaproteobacteria bacterium]
MAMTTDADIADLDAADPLAAFHDAFSLPDGVIYLCGNSLGPPPRDAGERLTHVTAQQWGAHLVRGWTEDGWITLPRRVGDKVARLIGAKPGEVAIADSTSVNLFKLLAAACGLRPDRTTILSQADNFPTDLYIAQGLAGLSRGHTQLRTVPAGAIADTIDDDTAVVMLSHVDYRTGALLDMKKLTAAAHAKGALALWDIAHSAGALPVDLNLAAADFAVGCGYKYLNGGPGAPAFLFVAERHQGDARSPLSGWMGHALPFDFAPDYRPADGITRFLCGTPVVLGIAALEVGLDLALKADPDALRHKSQALGNLFIARVEALCADDELTLISPRAAAARGSQVCLTHRQGYPVMQALIDRGVIGDFRAPDIMRFGFAPLYLSYGDIVEAARILADVLATGAWDQPKYHQRTAVT